MILQALTEYYSALIKSGRVCPPGWSTAKVSYALNLAPDGTLTDVLPVKILSENGKKEIPQPMRVPEQGKRSVNIASNFLCDNSSYLLGIDTKGKPERSKKCFADACRLHHSILDGTDCPEAKAVLAFFDTWRPESAGENSVLAPFLEDILAGSNLVFRMNGAYLHDCEAIRSAWDQAKKLPSTAPIGCCLVTGKTAPVARLHPSVKGIKGAQSSGASLVSFNAAAFESYGHEIADSTGQGYNAPVSEEAAFAYTTALQYLINDRSHVQRIADTTILSWAQDALPEAQDVFSAMVFGIPDGKDSQTVSQAELARVIRSVLEGKAPTLRGIPINPDNEFYILGLAPNASRLSVRFFLHNTFGDTVQYVAAHNKRLEIERPAFEKRTSLPLWALLNETANQKAKDKTPPAPMAGAVIRSILSENVAYPASLFEAVMLRIRAERDIGWRKAAILKAYFLKNEGTAVPEEVLDVKLNEDSNYPPYVLGRLFAVLEKIQTDTAPGIKTTIRDKYFNSASSTPASIFPLLISLSQHHQRKLNGGSKIFYDKLITDLESRLTETLPARMTLSEQGAFHLGYYHQKQKLFEKKDKEDTDNG